MHERINLEMLTNVYSKSTVGSLMPSYIDNIGCFINGLSNKKVKEKVIVNEIVEI